MAPRVVAPDDRDLGHLVPEAARQPQHLGIEAESLEALPAEQLPRDRPAERLEPALAVADPRKSRSETSPLKVRPASPRSQGCRTRMSDPATRRDPMATSAPPSRAARSFATSSIGVERSASVNRTCAWRATSMPRRTLPPLPVFRELRSTDTRPDARPSSAATSLVPSTLPSSTTMISTGSARLRAYSISRLSVPGSRRASLYAGTTIESPGAAVFGALRRLWLHRDSARLPAPIGRTRHGYHARAPSMGA